MDTNARLNMMLDQAARFTALANEARKAGHSTDPYSTPEYYEAIASVHLDQYARELAAQQA